MKKIAIVALSAMLVLGLAGCDKKGGSSKAALAAAANGDYSKLKVQKDPSTKKAYDFGGIDVVIFDYWTGPEPAAPTNKAQEDQAAYRQYLMDTYNFTCKQIGDGWGEHPTEVANYCITGDDSEARIFIIDGRSAIPGYLQGLWADVSNVPGVDWKDKKWNKAVCSVLPGYTFSADSPEPRAALFFNKRILKDNGFDPDEPYNLQKEGKWTWQTFEDMCAALTKDTDNDGVIDQYAMSSFNSEFIIPALLGNGTSLVKTDANGNYYLNTDDKVLESFTWAMNMFDKYQLPANGGNWDYYKTGFTNGTAAFMADQQYQSNKGQMLQDMKDDWGMVCWPSKEEGKVFTTNQDNMLVVPAFYSQDKVNKIVKIYDLWTDPVPGYDDDDAWKENFYDNFRDTRAVDETMAMMRENSKAFTEWLLPNFRDNYSKIVWSWSDTPWETPQQGLERVGNELQGYLDDINNQ
ncbi:MAG: hypothetical protein IKX70_04615 [Treponema sp.]|nr:hypothetical protein [Treponema sp.]